MPIPSRRILPVVALLLLLALLASAATADLSVQEASLSAGGQVYEVNAGPNGLLYLSDLTSQEVWRVDPVTGAYTVYQGVSPQDARADAGGVIWFTDGAEQFGRINPATNVKTLWSAGPAGEVNLWGVAFDASNRVWFSEWFGSGSRLWRFNPANRELCSYSPSGGASSYYLLSTGNQIWLGNWAAGKLMRLDLTSNQLRAWQLPAGSSPVGLALDSSGALWWADAPNGVPLRGAAAGAQQPGSATTVGALARLEPDLNRLTRYTLPAGSDPQWLAVLGSAVWYSEITGRTVGKLEPSQAAGSQSILTTTDEVLTSSCSTLGVGSSSLVTIRTGALAFSAGSWSTAVNSGGWTVYQMPAGAAPFGLARSGDTLWIGDQGRQKLAKTTPSTCYPFDVHPLPPACDGDVDIADVMTVAGCFQQPFGPSCPALLDFNASGAIDVADITLVAQQWGWRQ